MTLLVTYISRVVFLLEILLLWLMLNFVAGLYVSSVPAAPEIKIVGNIRSAVKRSIEDPNPNAVVVALLNSNNSSLSGPVPLKDSGKEQDSSSGLIKTAKREAKEQEEWHWGNNIMMRIIGHFTKRTTDNDQYDLVPRSSPPTTAQQWPSGTYGLPKPLSGCPHGEGFAWKSGHRYHDTEDDDTENQRSEEFHMSGTFSEEGIRHEFCIKDDEQGSGRWPDGKYCIYKRGTVCPAGLKEGFVIWDDENIDNKNSYGGELPEGTYNEDTKIYFCCSTSGYAHISIKLPTHKPFYLLAYESTRCQKVSGMKAISEFIKFDDEDRGNVDYEGGEYPFGIQERRKDHMLFLCYYHPENQSTTNKAADEESYSDVDNLEKSTEMIHEFLSSSTNNDDISKSERTKTIIKTIKIREKDFNSAMIATTVGMVLGAAVLGVAAVIIVSRYLRIKRDGMKLQPMSFSSRPGTPRRRIRLDSLETSGEDEECVAVMEDELFEDELVEDQYLPSDSELKSGLELMFLKQQRRYWTRAKSNLSNTQNTKSNSTISLLDTSTTSLKTPFDDPTLEDDGWEYNFKTS